MREKEREREMNDDSVCLCFSEFGELQNSNNNNSRPQKLHTYRIH